MGNVASIGQTRNTCKRLVTKLELKRQLEKYRPRWKNIKIDVKELNCEN